jgi:membrane protein DedA with SNARE-associated domain
MSAEALLALLIGFKYLALYFIVIVEGFFATIAGGALSAQGIMNLYAVMAVVVAGDLTADYLFFTFGKKISKSRFSKLFGLAPSQIHRVERIFNQHGPNTLVIAKLSSYLAIPVIVSAGAIHMPKNTFWKYCAFAATLKATALVLLGYYFGREIHHLVNVVILISIIISIMVVGYAVGSHYLRSAASKKKPSGQE